MSTVTECARALGEAIVASKEYQEMQITENAAMSDPAVANAMSRFLELKGKVNEIMGQPDADPDEIARYGREMDEVQQELNAMPAVDAMTGVPPKIFRADESGQSGVGVHYYRRGGAGRRMLRQLRGLRRLSLTAFSPPWGEKHREKDEA